MDEAEQLSDRVLIVDHGRAIAEGTPKEIIGRLGADSVIELSVSGNASTFLAPLATTLETLRAMNGVLAARADGHLISLHVESAHSMLPQLLAELARSRVALDDLRTHRPTLEDVFVSLTGRQLRDN
jgi:ABC-2 type transport system ATP-binding protein